MGDSRCVLFIPYEGTSHIDDVLLCTEHDSIRSMNGNEGKRNILALQMSEDHKLSLTRERRRIVNKSKYRCAPLPSDVIKGYTSSFSTGMSVHGGGQALVSRKEEENEDIEEGPDLEKSGFLEHGYPSPELLDRAKSFIETLSVLADVAPKAVVYSDSAMVSMLHAIDQTG